MATAGARPPSVGLPADVNRFFGRRQEAAEAKRLLSVTRLLTLTGVGGVGKTRLALRVAADVQRAFPDGVHLVELADLRDPALLGNTVATSMGLLEQSARWRVTALIEHIDDKQMLLVLDNCEHLADACAVLVDSLMRECGGLRILVTSRELLRVSGESILTVPPLPVPPSKAPPTAQTLIQYDSVNLFLDRADAALPGFTITEENHHAVARLCARLDGLPLAMELAAVRLRVLSVDEILARLDDRYRLLAAGSRSGPDRQRSLRACIDWSHDNCTPEERTVWMRLSVLPGLFDVETAEGVCATDDLSADQVFEVLASLVDKSVLQRDTDTSAPGFRMLETLREYGQARLREAGEESTVQRRHRDWFVDLVHQAAQDWVSPRQVGWIWRLRRNHASLRAALEFCSTPEEAVQGLRIVIALEPYWLVRGMLGEARHWLARLLPMAGTAMAEQSRAIRLAAWFAILQADPTDSGDHLREAVALARKTNDVVALAYATQTIGMFAALQGDFAEGTARLEEALGWFRAADDVAGEVSTLFFLGMATGIGGDPEAAAVWNEQCLSVTESREECQWRAHALWSLGLDAFRLGDFTQAALLEKQALKIARQIDDVTSIATVLECLAVIAAGQSNHELAAQLCGAADRLYRLIGASSEMVPGLYRYRAEAEENARTSLGNRAFQTAYGRGVSAPLDESAELALGEKVQDGPSDALLAGARTPLTPREREVANLVAEGLNNRDISRRLVISQRTAEGHVEKILNKLGFGNRAQIAAWVTERRGSNTY